MGTRIRGQGLLALSLHIRSPLNMLLCMRTTLDINDRLLAEAKALATARGLSVKALIEEALRERLHGRVDGYQEVTALPTYTGNGLQPGIDLSDSAALLETMDAVP